MGPQSCQPLQQQQQQGLCSGGAAPLRDLGVEKGLSDTRDSCREQGEAGSWSGKRDGSAASVW